MIRPPVFDSPATSGLFDSRTTVLFSADSFGAFIPDVAQDVTDVPEGDFAQGFELFNRGNRPWSAYVDRGKFDELVADIDRLQPEIIASCHAPLARGRMAAHLEAMRAIGGIERDCPSFG